MGVHWKIQLLGKGGSVHKKPIYRRGNCLKGSVELGCRYKRGLGKKERSGTFSGSYYPQCTLWVKKITPELGILRNWGILIMGEWFWDGVADIPLRYDIGKVLFTCT